MGHRKSGSKQPILKLVNPDHCGRATPVPCAFLRDGNARVRPQNDVKSATVTRFGSRLLGFIGCGVHEQVIFAFLQQRTECGGARLRHDVRFSEPIPGRDIYVSDADLKAVWNAACWPAQEMLDVAYLLGQRPQDVYALTLDKIDQELVSIKQLKTGRKIRIENEGELTQVLARIRARVRRPGVRALVVNERGEAFTPGMFKKRFNKARNAAGVQFQLRDLRAKNATDTDDLALAQKRLAHASRAMTEHYVRQRLGEKVKPLNRKITGD